MICLTFLVSNIGIAQVRTGGEPRTLAQKPTAVAQKATAAAVATNNGKLGMIDKTGKWVVPAMFEEIRRFDSGFAMAKLEGKDRYN